MAANLKLAHRFIFGWKPFYEKVGFLDVSSFDIIVTCCFLTNCGMYKSSFFVTGIAFLMKLSLVENEDLP